MCTNAAFLYHMVFNQAHDLLYTVEDVVALGYTTIIAAGDSSPGLELGGGNSCHFSPTHPDAIRVGALSNGGAYAINIDNEIISFDSGSGRNPKAPDSNFGECVDIWAPGRSTLVESLSCDVALSSFDCFVYHKY